MLMEDIADQMTIACSGGLEQPEARNSAFTQSARQYSGQEIFQASTLDFDGKSDYGNLDGQGVQVVAQ